MCVVIFSFLMKNNNGIETWNTPINVGYPQDHVYGEGSPGEGSSFQTTVYLSIIMRESFRESPKLAGE